MLITIIGFAFVIAMLSVEALIVKKRVRNIHLRIHVNGTRGKSSVSEYIAAGLRTNKNVLCKVTGVKPTIIYPDGKKEIIKRKGRARVKEQFEMVRLASKLHVDALVLECMSILPELQIVESRNLTPQIYVITNIRDDHREEMGVALDEQAKAICSAIPRNTTVLTSEDKFLPLIKQYSRKKNCNLISVNKLDPEYLSRIPDGIFDVNIALALEACAIAGIDKETAFANILNAINNNPVPMLEFLDKNKSIRFVDGFAVNDVPSARGFLQYWKNKFDEPEELLVILNTRNDRPLRSVQFAEWLGKEESLSKIILTGTHIPRTRREILSAGYNKDNVYIWNGSDIKNSLASLQKIITKNSLVFGFGNIAGDGFLILDSLYNAQETKW
jgi:gamma-polyglutamate synthase